MPITLILTLIILLISAALVRRYSNLPDNVWKLFLAQPLAMSSTPAIVVAAGILAISIAPNPELATLPLTLVVIGTASAVIPATAILRYLGRRKGTIIGLTIGLTGACLSALAAYLSQFNLLLIGSFMLGVSSAFVAQLRFAALESIDNPNQAPLALSILMSSGLFSAMIGPEIAVVAKDWVISDHGFVGSYLVLACLILCAIFVISRLDAMQVKEPESHHQSRPLSHFFTSPLFLVALSSGTVAYSVMTYLMTASPLSMHSDHAYDMASIKWVVQSHVLAMYLPSLFSAWLVAKIGIRKLMLIGTSLYVAVVTVSLTGHSVMHYWWAMVLLGVGWNFLYLSGTLLLPKVYRTEERFKIQAVNDFAIFGIQALASLSAGVILFSQGWSVLVSITIPVIILMFLITLWYITVVYKNEIVNIGETNG